MGEKVKEFRTFSKGTSPEVNVKELLEFEIAYVDDTVQLVSHNVLVTHLICR